MSTGGETRKKRLWALIAAAVLLGAGYFALDSYETSQKPDRTDQMIKIFDAEADDITSLSWSYQDENIELFRTGDDWVNSDDPFFPVDSEVINLMVDALASTQTMRRLDGNAPLSEYGLDKPLFSIKATLANGEERTYLVGDLNPISKEHYIKIHNTNTIYSIGGTLPGLFMSNPTDILKFEEIPRFQGAHNVVIQVEDKTLDISSDTVDGNARNWYALENGISKQLNSAKVGDLQFEMFRFERDRCVTYNATAAQLEAYGLAQPEIMISVSYYDNNNLPQKFTASLSDSGEGFGYTRIGDSSMVYEIPLSLIKLLRATTVDSLM